MKGRKWTTLNIGEGKTGERRLVNNGIRIVTHSAMEFLVSWLKKIGQVYVRSVNLFMKGNSMTRYEIMREKIEAGTYDNKLNWPGSGMDGDLKELRKKYHQENGRLRNLFQSDLEETYGLAQHPKKDVLWKLAWEHGHR